MLNYDKLDELRFSLLGTNEFYYIQVELLDVTWEKS